MTWAARSGCCGRPATASSRPGRATARALVHLARGAAHRAELDLARAEHLFATTSQTVEVAFTWHNRGLVAFRSGDLPAALACLDEAGHQYSQLAVPPLELAATGVPCCWLPGCPATPLPKRTPHSAVPAGAVAGPRGGPNCCWPVPGLRWPPGNRAWPPPGHRPPGACSPRRGVSGGAPTRGCCSCRRAARATHRPPGCCARAGNSRPTLICSDPARRHKRACWPGNWPARWAARRRPTPT